ncbi:hypothetical protein SAMN05518672_11023 [Chitinophaga sp. CF118]|uniref:hypothetical protein n=1 Tax=Chitinophaga sp. CF118 TaxID=1884367 RepID=UPI0008EC123C|nr:hypothetical protein [Chitinophaga sp. CF118]SFE76861.1 hypothetical protein SAMN05518672_11023 [Chitinophaga sp. CF118]
MKRIIALIAFILPVALNAQTKLAENIVEDLTHKIAEHYELKNDLGTLFIADQLSRSGAGGLDIDKTMAELKGDPAALDAALKFYYQYSDCNRQQLIANLRALGIQSNSVFPVATYTVNKFKGEAKDLQEEKAALVKSGGMPVLPPPGSVKPKAKPTVAATTDNENITPAQQTTTETAATTTASEPAAKTEDTYNWDVRTLFKLRRPEQLVELYGKENVASHPATDLQGNDAGIAYYVFPDTDNEMEVIFDGEKGTAITFTKEHAKWKSPFGIKVGDPIDKVVKVNGRNFKINGFEWEDGGIVDSWEGGTIAGKGVSVQFKVNNTGEPKYDQVTGGKKVNSDMSVLKKLDVVVEKIVFKSN